MRGRLLAGCLLSLLFLALTAWFELEVMKKPQLFHKQPPEFIIQYGWRYLLVVLSSIALVWGLHGPPRLTTEADFEKQSRQLRGPLLCLPFLWLVWFTGWPGLFYYHSSEHGLAEILSVIALVGTGILSLRSALLAWSQENDREKVFLFLVLSVLGFFLAGEEISWSDIIFHFDLPQLFQEHNAQRELNLHNFATKESEVAFFLFGFASLVVLPFWLSREGNGRRFEALLPNQSITLLVASQVAFSYLTWSTFVVPWIFFSTLLILGVYVQERPEDRPYLVLLILLILGGQSLLLALPDHHVKAHRVAEYRECLIALGLFLWSVKAAMRTKN